MWQDRLQPWVDKGEVVVIGVVQEQHPDRARLYRQWRQLPWPIAVDALNLLEFRVVPIPMALDASGIVRAVRPGLDALETEFLRQTFDPTPVPAGYNRLTMEQLPAGARALFAGQLDEAVRLYRQETEADPDRPAAHFRLGVALRRRFEQGECQPGDGQRAVQAWGTALALNPDQYIWRRRLQQYGPRLNKPYNFYFWVEAARKDIRARGEDPIPLGSEPQGSEVAPPMADATPGPLASPDPDPKGQIGSDEKGLVQVESVVTPSPVRPGQTVRIRVQLRLDPQQQGWWNNEADPLIWAPQLPKGLTLTEADFHHPQPARPETQEVRVLELEATVAPEMEEQTLTISGYVLYAVCEDAGGVCHYLRQEVEVPVQVSKAAPVLE